MVEKAYKLLLDPDKRRLYQRIMREARDRVEIERKRENKKREKEGKQLLPEDTFEIDVQNMCTLLFEKIEQSKDLHTKMEQVNRKRVHKEVERRKLMKEIEKEDEKAWEENRDKRVKQWRTFEKIKKGSRKRARHDFKPPKVKMQGRPPSAPKIDEAKPMGIDDSYKRQWK